MSHDEITLDDIVRRHYETGEYGGVSLRFEPDGWAVLRERFPKPDRSMAPLGAIFGIRVRLDDTLPKNVWRLVDENDTVLHEGILPAAAEQTPTQPERKD